MISSRRSGTSLVEILVVIVVFLVGILAIVQIFPSGFRILSVSQKNSVATWLARTEIEMLKNHADQLPDAIVPVQYTWSGSQVVIDKQPERFPGDLGPSYNNMGPDGTMYDGGGNAIGNWQFLAGANIGRRVLGEGKPIPTPRLVGAEYGSLLSLQFAPIVYNPTGNYRSIFVVYGNDMSRRAGDPTTGGPPPRSTEYFLDEEDSNQAALYLPQNAGKLISYRLEMTVYADNGTTGLRRRDLVDIVVPLTTTGSGWEKVNIEPLLGGGDSLKGVEFDSVRVSRAFDDVNITNGGVFTNDPYEFKLLSPQLGLVLFNEKGYNYVIRGRNGRRDPLIGRVSYDVYDWRILRDEFRMPDTNPPHYRLAVGSLKVSNEMGPDGRPNQGIGVPVPDSTATYGPADLALQDTDTGSLFVFKEGTKDPTLTSYTVNKSVGSITLLDYDNDPSNGTQLRLVYPGSTTVSTITADGRSLRALYMGKNEWAVQVMKPAARYTQTWGRPGIGQFYIGQSEPTSGGLGNRIYFPPADAGRIVSIGELYYFDSGGRPVGPVQLTAKLQTNAMDNGGQTNRLPYIDVSSYYSDFGSFDYSYTSAVKSVKGASIAVRVLWNPDFFTLDNNAATNMKHLETWMQSWRRSTVETYLQRGY